MDPATPRAERVPSLLILTPQPFPRSLPPTHWGPPLKLPVVQALNCSNLSLSPRLRTGSSLAQVWGQVDRASICSAVLPRGSPRPAPATPYPLSFPVSSRNASGISPSQRIRRTLENDVELTYHPTTSCERSASRTTRWAGPALELRRSIPYSVVHPRGASYPYLGAGPTT